MLLFILILVGTGAIGFFAQSHVKSVFARYSVIPASSGATGAEVADAILRRAGINDVEILEHDQMLGDHYDSINKRLVLSSENYRGNSIAAIGVAAHECGHALQHQQAYAPLQWRVAAIAAVNFLNPIGMYLPMGFMFFHFISWHLMLLLMSVSTGAIMLFNLVTLPVEFDASNRAKQIVGEMGFIRSEEEMDGVRKTLDAAGWTYVAAFISSLAVFLYYFLPLLLGGRRNN